MRNVRKEYIELDTLHRRWRELERGTDRTRGLESGRRERWQRAHKMPGRGRGYFQNRKVCGRLGENGAENRLGEIGDSLLSLWRGNVE